MDRRKSIKTLLIGAAGTGVLVEACKQSDKKEVLNSATASVSADRMQEEKDYLTQLQAGAPFFTPQEMTVIALLSDIIIPKDSVSGSATEAKVPDFIEFIVKDMPEHQTPIRGGLRWLEMQSFKQFNQSFSDATEQQRIQLVDQIAYPDKAALAMKQGVSFFNLMRDLVTTGFYTSEMGVKDLGYMGNVPNQWNGVPDDVLKQYGYAYSERELKECVSYDKTAG
ncbi:MAG: gluconate 2-dehydrogenase subunit 3 family protein [Chitinophagia bacterium]|nr:gluconate 2-dehydrogenase subunit 3 family protein [Chitinophagia bacterium]